MSFLNQERLRNYPIIICAVSWLAYVLWISLGTGLIDKSDKPVGADFICFYATSTVLAQSPPEKVYDVKHLFAKEAEILGVPVAEYDFPSLWFYPPTYLLFVKYLAQLDYLPSLILWTLVTFVFFVFSSRLILPNRLSYLWFFTFTGVYHNAVNGQNGFLSAGIFTLSLYLLDKRPFAAGLILGIITYKPHLALPALLILAVTLRIRVLAGFALSAGLLALASYLAFGLEPWIAFFHILPWADAKAMSGALPWARMNSVQAALLSLGMGPLWARGIHMVVALTVLGLTVRLWRGRASFNLRAAALLVATLIFVPFGYDYDLVILAPAMVWFGVQAWKDGWLPYEKSVLAVAWITPVLSGVVASASYVIMTPLVLLWFFALIYSRDLRTRTNGRPVSAQPA